MVKEDDPKLGIQDFFRKSKFPRLKGPVSRIRPVKPIRLDKAPFVLRRRGIRIPLDRTEELERRAVSKLAVYGTLSERIVWKEFRRRGFDFDFQSSLLGGRQILGGKVADYIVYLPYGPVIVRVQSFAFHSGWAARRKDKEDKAILETLIDPYTQKNYVVYDLWEDVIFEAERLAEWIDRNLLGNYQGQGVRAPRGGGIEVPSQKEWDEHLLYTHAQTARLNDVTNQLGFLLNLLGGGQVGPGFVVDTLNIRTSAITDAKIASCSVDKLTAGTIQSGEHIKVGSGTKDSSLTGFQIDPSEIVGQLSGATQVKISAVDGKFYAAGDLLYIDVTALSVKDEFTYATYNTAAHTYNTSARKFGDTALHFQISNQPGTQPFIIYLKESPAADIRFYNRSSNPIGAAAIGDTCVVGAKLMICTAAGTPGTWAVVGSQS